MTADDELSAAVIAYLQRGRAASPRADAPAAAAVARERDPAALVSAVDALVEESVAVPVEWSTLTLGEAGRAVAAEMGKRHPELSTEALDALAWNFTFVWR